MRDLQRKFLLAHGSKEEQEAVNKETAIKRKNRY